MGRLLAAGTVICGVGSVVMARQVYVLRSDSGRTGTMYRWPLVAALKSQVCSEPSAATICRARRLKLATVTRKAGRGEPGPAECEDGMRSTGGQKPVSVTIP